ncbi:MAG: hypothetical protein AAF756_19860 [Pseudomonadota bacterium]
MKKSFNALSCCWFFCFLVGIEVSGKSSHAGVCEFDEDSMEALYRNPNSPFKVEYSFKKSKPGDEFDLADKRYVMVRVPFADLATGELYAVNYPSLILGYPNSHNTQFHLSVSQRKATDEPCSDVAVKGSDAPTHQIPASARASVMGYGFNDELHANTSVSLGLMLSFRTASTLVSVPVGVETKPYPDCFGGKPYGPTRKGIKAEDCAPLV